MLIVGLAGAASSSGHGKFFKERYRLMSSATDRTVSGLVSGKPSGSGNNTPAMLWTGRVMTGIFAIFMLGASITPKLLQMPVAEETLAQLGWPAGYSLMIGVIELICLLLYLAPRTSVLGAVLMTGLLGGAMATQIRAESPLFSHILFSVYLGLIMWGGLWLRSQMLRTVIPCFR